MKRIKSYSVAKNEGSVHQHRWLTLIALRRNSEIKKRDLFPIRYLAFGQLKKTYSEKKDIPLYLHWYPQNEQEGNRRCGSWALSSSSCKVCQGLPQAKVRRDGETPSMRTWIDPERGFRPQRILGHCRILDLHGFIVYYKFKFVLISRGTTNP